MVSLDTRQPATIHTQAQHPIRMCQRLHSSEPVLQPPDPERSGRRLPNVAGQRGEHTSTGTGRRCNGLTIDPAPRRLFAPSLVRTVHGIVLNGAVVSDNSLLPNVRPFPLFYPDTLANIPPCSIHLCTKSTHQTNLKQTPFKSH